LIDRPLVELFEPESRGAVSDHLTEGQTRRVASVAEARITRPDGQSRDVEVSSVWLEEETTLHITLRDITERRSQHARLRDSEERLRLALAGAQEGVWDWDLETNAVMYSARWKEMLGYADDEVEPHVNAWERLLHPDDRPQALQAVNALALGQETYRVECRLRHKAGHFIHVLSRGYPVRRRSDGRVVRIVGTHLDLTDQKCAEAALRESEERLKLAFAGAQEGVWDWNLETGAVVYSKHWKEMLGYEEDEIEPHLSAWERLLHPEDRARTQEVNLGVVAGQPEYEMEFRLRHKDGHYVPVLSRGLPLRNADGAVVRIVGTHLDLTERKRAEEVQELERAERARTELLTRLVFAQEDERRRIAREMHDQFGEHLTALARRIEVLKDLSRTDDGLAAQVDALEIVAQRLDRDVDYLVWELRPTALDDLGLRAALTTYVKDWSNRVNIPVNLHTSGLLDVRLSSEVETTLYRIAQEALTNVARHARASHVDILLERRADAVVLAVEDNGVGFEASGGPTPDGHGFGLLGMQERAALVGATLQIESSVGQGTTVLVRMTAAAAAADTHATHG
jgi:PAS domain S-box-containing protein